MCATTPLGVAHGTTGWHSPSGGDSFLVWRQAAIDNDANGRGESTATTQEVLRPTIEDTRTRIAGLDLVRRAASRTKNRERTDLGVARKAVDQLFVVVPIDRREPT
jgi:hypothetical protein